MYNQYLNGDDLILLDPEPESHPPHRQHHQEHHRPHHSGPPQSVPPKPGSDLLGEVTGGLTQLLEGVLKHFSLEKFDTGDILLVLIILFLYLEGDNLELVITLGLLLLLGLGDNEKEKDHSPGV